MNAVPTPVPTDVAPATPATLLRIADVAKSFGGAQVLESVTLDVRVGETLGLIGPNGAGKTTLFNIITGFLPPDTGAVVFDGRELGAMPPPARARLGLVRTFQKSLVFPTQSIRRNVAMAVRAKQGAGYRWWGGRAAHARADDAAQALIDGCALRGRGDEIVADLSYGEQRIVDMLIALAQAPRILLLDEPTAGLSTEEAAQLLALARQHHADTAVVLIAHDLDVVFRECDRIAVLDLGRLLTVDTPDAVRQHPGVQAAYLGALAEGRA
jgi:branched-chain amino acid transport system ATP-binding protein